MSLWIQALQEFNHGRTKYIVPKRGTPEYESVMDIMQRLRNQQQGEGIRSKIKSIAKKAYNIFDAIFGGIRTTASPAIKKMINEMGHLEVVQMNVCRSPIESTYKGILISSLAGNLRSD